MKNILIINLRRIGDVYATGHLINSLAQNNNCSISMLVYKESESAARNLKNVANLHVIDRKEIITLKVNKLFSDGFALEQLFIQLEKIKSQKWDEIINYSNDLVGAYICSYLRASTEKVTGVYFNSQKRTVSSSDWDLLFNDILPIVKYAPVHFVDCYHKMIGADHNRDGEKLITNAEHNALAFSNIGTMRKNLAVAESVIKIIGIQLKSSDETKDISKETIIKLLEIFKTNSDIVPILLIAPFDEEREYAQGINEVFNNEIAIVEADLQAVASVLLNIDLLITPDTAIKHIADLTETPVLEISLGQAPLFKQGTYSQGSLILTDIITERNFTKENNLKITKTNIKAADIMSAILYFFSKATSVRPLLSKDVTLYSCSFDQLGARYSVVAGSTDAQTEIHRLMSRQVINVIYGAGELTEIYSAITDFGSTASSLWCQKEKSNLTEVMKDLLGTLRALIQSQENRKSSKDFVLNLGKLIAHADISSIVQISSMMFKAKIDLIESKSFEENAKEVETLLYELKSDIQKVLLCIKKLEDQIAVQKKDNLVNRTPEQANN